MTAPHEWREVKAHEHEESGKKKKKKKAAGREQARASACEDLLKPHSPQAPPLDLSNRETHIEFHDVVAGKTAGFCYSAAVADALFLHSRA